MGYERKNIRDMAGYASGEQPESGEVIKLNTNENPFPPGPMVAAALNEIRPESLRRYPQPTAAALRATIARHHQLDSDNVIVTNGGDELLRLVMATFVDNSEAIAVAEPTYTLYQVLAQAQGCGLVSFTLDDNWRLPVDFSEKLHQSEAKICLLPNPHAPSGTLIQVEAIEKLARAFKGVLVVDEAYVDFVDPGLGHDCVSLIKALDNLIILRTFSKGYSLAGLRMAYGLGAKSLIDPMQYKTKDSYNTDHIAQRLAEAAMLDQAYASATWKHVREQRRIVHEALSALGFSSFPSQSNFILTTVPPGHSAEDIYQSLKKHGILVRYFNQDRLRDKLRISIGTEAENQQLVSTLNAIVKPGKRSPGPYLKQQQRKKRAKLGKRNRNIISGLLVGVASIYAVVSYVNLPREEVASFFFSTLLFFVLIVILAGLTILVIKGLPALIRRFSAGSSSPRKHQDRDKE